MKAALHGLQQEGGMRGIMRGPSREQSGTEIHATGSSHAPGMAQSTELAYPSPTDPRPHPTWGKKAPAGVKPAGKTCTAVAYGTGGP